MSSCLLFVGLIDFSILLNFDGSLDIAVIGEVCKAIERSGPPATETSLTAFPLFYLGEMRVIAPYLPFTFLIPVVEF